LESQGFSWALVQAQRDLVELRLSIRRQIGAPREILSQQEIGVFVRSTLPETLRIAEIDFQIVCVPALLAGNFRRPNARKNRAFGTGAPPAPNYGEGEKFIRVYIDREKAEGFAARQKKSPVVKSVRVTEVD
jgi:hypothetical protein